MGTQAHPFVTAAYCLELSPLKKIWGAAKVTPWLEKPHVFTIWLFTEKSADPWPSSIDPWSSSCWAWKMGNCCWQSEGEGWRVLGRFFSSFLPLESAGWLDQLLKVAAFTRWSLKYKTLSFSTGQHLLPPPPLQAQGRWCTSLFQDPGDCTALWFLHTQPLLL